MVFRKNTVCETDSNQRDNNKNTTAHATRTHSAPPYKEAKKGLHGGTSLLDGILRKGVEEERIQQIRSTAFNELNGLKGIPKDRDSMTFYNSTVMYVSPTCSVEPHSLMPFCSEESREQRESLQSPQFFSSVKEHGATGVRSVASSNDAPFDERGERGVATDRREGRGNMKTRARSVGNLSKIHQTSRRTDGRQIVSDVDYVNNGGKTDSNLSNRPLAGNLRPNSSTVFFSRSEGMIGFPRDVNNMFKKGFIEQDNQEPPQPPPPPPQQQQQQPTTATGLMANTEANEFSPYNHDVMRNEYRRNLERALPLRRLSFSSSSWPRRETTAAGAAVTPRALADLTSPGGISSHDLSEGGGGGGDERRFWRDKNRHDPSLWGKDTLAGKSGWEVLQNIRQLLEARRATAK